jgi:type II secretion system protein C
MRNSFLIASIIGILSGMLLAQVIYLGVEKKVVSKEVQIASFRIDGNLLKPYYITPQMIDELRGVNRGINKTNILNNWKLTATYISSEPVAMLANGSNVSVLRVGEKLEDFTLHSVKDMSVEFENSSGDIVELFMDIAYTDSVKSGAQKFVANEPPSEFKLTQGSIDNYLKKPEELLKTVSVVPELEGSAFKGLKVNGVKQYSFLYNFGVRKGDTIIGINGKRLNSINDALKEYQNILNLREFEVTILRNNQEKVMKYEVVN